MVNNGQTKAYQTVVEYIKKGILSGHLKQGQMLPPERELAEITGVSRNSVREALRTLDIMGMVQSTQGAGNVISYNFEKSLVESMSMMFLMEKIDYTQLSELRRGLEKEAIVLAVDKISRKQLGQLESLVKQLALTYDENVNVDLDKKLHYTIAQASGNQLIILVLRALDSVMDRFIKDLRQRIAAGERGCSSLQTIHEKMVECIKNKDKQGACNAMDAHFEIIDKNMIKL